MAERSFAHEVQKLRAGEGSTFSGEGILAVTKALLQSGVAYVGGYQGAPVSHLMDVLADAESILDELGVHFEASASEATAAAMLSASINYPLRGAVTWKSTVGTNVASDALGARVEALAVHALARGDDELLYACGASNPVEDAGCTGRVDIEVLPHVVDEAAERREMEDILDTLESYVHVRGISDVTMNEMHVSR